MTFASHQDSSGGLDAPILSISGRIVDVGPQAFRVSGLSPFVKLGDCIGCPGENGEEFGEVVRISYRDMKFKSCFQELSSK